MARCFSIPWLVRIVPYYWLLITVIAAGLVLVPELFNSRTPDWAWITASYLFVPWPSPARDVSPPVGPGWTLNSEMYFYVIFGASLVLSRRVALLSAAVAIFTAAPMVCTNGDLATLWRLPFFSLLAAALMALVILRPGLHMKRKCPSTLSPLFLKLVCRSVNSLTHIGYNEAIDQQE